MRRPMRRPMLRAGVAAGMAAGAALALPVSASAAPGCQVGKVAPKAETALTKLINHRRASAGLAKVHTKPSLRRAGRRLSSAIARGGAFAHTVAGLEWARGRHAGQNLAMAPSPRVAMRAMLGDAAHRRILLDRKWRLGGVGAARDCRGRVYFTINLMARRA